MQQAVRKASKLDAPGLARLLFEDELAGYAVDKAAFVGARYAEINRQQTATEDAAPYLLVPKAKSGLGVVLVHGFLASPAELRGFAQKLFEQGHVVLGVRLKGHGTSPWDLNGRKWQDWLASVLVLPR